MKVTLKLAPKKLEIVEKEITLTTEESLWLKEYNDVNTKIKETTNEDEISDLIERSGKLSRLIHENFERHIPENMKIYDYSWETEDLK